MIELGQVVYMITFGGLIPVVSTELNIHKIRAFFGELYFSTREEAEKEFDILQRGSDRKLITHLKQASKLQNIEIPITMYENRIKNK